MSALSFAGVRGSCGPPVVPDLSDPPLTIPQSSERLPAPAFMIWDGVAAIGLALLLAQFLWVEFTRIEPEKVLNHPSRAAIVESVRQNPGADLTTLVQGLGLSRAVARKHVAILERFGQVSAKRFRGRTALFVRAQTAPRHHERMHLLRRDPFRRAYGLLVGSPALDQTAIGQRLGVSRQRTSVILRRLESAGLARVESAGARHAYYPIGY